MIDDIDRLVARRETEVAIPSFEVMLARRRARPRMPLAPFVIAAAAAIVVAGAAIGPLREQLASPGAARPAIVAVPAGSRAVSPDGTRIAVTDASAVRVYDATGAALATDAAPGATAAWIGSDGVLVQRGRGGPLEVLSLDGRVTPLGFSPPPTTLSYTSASTDGRLIAAQSGGDVVVASRDGGSLTKLLTGTLVGWDAGGRLVFRYPTGQGGGLGAWTGTTFERIESTALSASASFGQPVPAPDRSATLVASQGDAELVITGSSLRLVASVMPWWTGDHTMLQRLGNTVAEVDVATGVSRATKVVLPQFAAIRAAAGTTVLWTIDGQLHASDLRTGHERALGPVPADAAYQALAGGRLAVVLPAGILFVAPE